LLMSIPFRFPTAFKNIDSMGRRLASSVMAARMFQGWLLR
jgi:hypothetical protein